VYRYRVVTRGGKRFLSMCVLPGEMSLRAGEKEVIPVRKEKGDNVEKSESDGKVALFKGSRRAKERVGKEKEKKSPTSSTIKPCDNG